MEKKRQFFGLNIIFIINFHYLESLEIMKGVIYIQLSIMLQIIQHFVRTSIDTLIKNVEQILILPKIVFEQYRYFTNFVRTVSILQNLCSNKYRYFQKCCSNSIDTSKMLFEQYRYFKK